MKEVSPGLYCWSWFSDEKGYDFNGYFLVSGGEKVMIDPPPLSPEDWNHVNRLGPPTSILITNRDHLREAPGLRSRFSCRILIHENDAVLIDIKPDGTFKGGDRLPGELVAVPVPDNKSPGETAFLLERDHGILFLGDALIGNPQGELNLMKPDKYADLAKAKEGIGALLRVRFDSVLVGDGTSILTGGRRAVTDFMEKGG
jgi:glyoxylase-like metal-dependent hydrolase (beta-lactamase superfamily II)